MKHAEIAERQGRQFSSFLERLAYPHEQVRLHLKARSRIMQLHGDDDAVLQHCESRIIYNDDLALRE